MVDSGRIGGLGLLLVIAACGDDGDAARIDAGLDAGADAAVSRCAGGDPDITVPAGLCATVFADGLGPARHLVVSPSGDVFVAIANSRDGRVPGKVVALRDTDHDGKSDVQQSFGTAGGTGIAWAAGVLYFGEDDRVVRWALPDGQLQPAGDPAVIVSGLPKSGDHPAKAIQIGLDGALYVSIGSETNSCQPVNRTPGTPGEDPCGELATRAGVWRFDATKTGQQQASGTRVATGVRNPTAFGVQPGTGALLTAINGRDQLHENWPSLFSAEDDKQVPSEELAFLPAGVDLGWPYCYYDPRDNKKKLAPEYGGDGQMQGRCAAIPTPLLALPAHWAPLGLVFSTGTLLPAAYRGGAFIAFHGSRFDPLADPRVPGYSVGFVPLDNPSAWSEIATGFAGDGRPLPDAAKHRPVGVAMAPDGALFISDDVGGRIWRVTAAP